MKNLQDIKFDFNAMCNFEIATGQTLMDFLSKGKIGLNDMRMLVKAGLNVGIDEAGQIISDYIANTENAIEELTNLFAKKFEESGLFGTKK